MKQTLPLHHFHWLQFQCFVITWIVWELNHLDVLSVLERCICFLFSSSSWWATGELSQLILSSTKSLGTWWIQELHYNGCVCARERASMHKRVWVKAGKNESWRLYRTDACLISLSFIWKSLHLSMLQLFLKYCVLKYWECRNSMGPQRSREVGFC